MVPVDGGKLKLAIADDGKGFAMHNTSKSVSSRLIKPFGPVSGVFPVFIRSRGRARWWIWPSRSWT